MILTYRGTTMEIKVLEQTKNKLVFRVEGEDHTILNLLKEELWNDDKVKVSAYRVDHPLTGVPEMTVEVMQGNDPKKALTEAVKRLTKKLDAYADGFKTALK